MINKAIILGNVGAEPEVRALDGGKKVARIRVATTERYTDQQGNKQEQTEWHTVVLWGGLADVVDRYVHKGSQLYIEGKIRTREWTDKDNQKRYTTEILATEMKLLGRPHDTNEAPQAVAPAPTPASTPAPPFGEIPF
ncbi:MAG: single-stranded DNA-binding protein [Alistipes sp.]|nr:single-stranded DNA-binding protein [Alistipes sp.]